MRGYYPPKPPQPKHSKRYGWYRKYEDFVGHPKWRLVSNRSGVHVAFVHVIVDALFQSAAKARKRGLIDGFDFEVCSAATDIPVEQVAVVVRVLNDIGWLEQDFIVDWADRQPNDEDPTATERQRTKRAKDKAKRAAMMGTAKAEDLELLSTDEREAMAKLRDLSRVTAQPASQPLVPLRPLVLNGTDEQQRVAARVWLFGAGGTEFGPASKIVADNFGCNRFSAHDMLIRWARELQGDVLTVAKIVNGAEQHALNAEAFQTVVRQRLDEELRLRENGPALPFGPAAIKGGRHG